MREYERIRTAIIRGGTSKGLYLMDNELPQDQEERNRVILALYGSPDVRQIDGLGGADPLTSKVAIIKPSLRADADVDYTFGQVAIDRAYVDYKSNCGNISSGVGPFAVDEGLVPAIEPVTIVRIFNTNTQKVIEAEVPVKNGKALTQGNCVIPGVPGSGAKIMLNFLDCSGSKTGKLLPTGNPKDIITLSNGKEIEVSLVDATTPAIIVKASDVGLTGKELPDEVNNSVILLSLLEEIRSIGAEMLGFVLERSRATDESPTIPKLVYVAESDRYTTLHGKEVTADKISFLARTMSMQKMHKAYAVTGGICTSTAALIPGTVVNEVLKVGGESSGEIFIGHPSGIMEFGIEIDYINGHIFLNKAAVARTSRRLMEGYAFVPSNIYGGKANDEHLSVGRLE